MGLFDRGGGGAVYRMKERLLAIGDDFWIEDAEGERAFVVDGKALRLRETFELRDRDGREVATIQERKLRIRDTMAIERNGRTVATVRKALISPFRDKFKVELADGGEWEARGDILDHEYEIENDGRRVAKVSKSWFRLRDTYGIEVEAGQDDGLVLAVAVALAAMREDEEEDEKTQERD
jgi:uncharacterized protein YxjI